MHPVLQKTLGGLTKQYYFRQLFFGCIFTALILFISSLGGRPTPLGVWFMMVVNTLLYPYSRFVYESIVNFIVGDHFFIVNAIFLLMIKLFTMALCWVFAIFIAPVGLAYLYIHHTRNETK